MYIWYSFLMTKDSVMKLCDKEEHRIHKVYVYFYFIMMILILYLVTTLTLVDRYISYKSELSFFLYR